MYYLQIYKETLLLASIIYLIFTIFPRTTAKIPSLDTVDMFGLLQIKK